MFKRIFAIIASCVLTTSAHAFDIVAWAAAGTTCVPDRQTAPKYDAFNQATVRHIGTQVGTLIFTCHVERFDSLNQSWVLRINYRDSTGTGGSASAAAQLYRIPVVAGFTPAAVGSPVNSDSFFGLGNATLVQPFSHTFDFEANTYFVQVTLSRASTSEIVRLATVSIEVGSPD